MARPQAYGSSGSAAASATPAASPTEVSTALETTTGSPHASATRSAARTPPSGCALSTDDVGGARRPARPAGPRPGGSTRRPRPARPPAGAARPARPGSRRAARRTPARTGRARAACARRVHVPGAVGVHPDPPVRAERVADRLHPGHVAGAAAGRARPPSPWRCGSRTRPRCACARSGPTAGTVTFTGTRSRTGAGQPCVAASSAAASQRAHSRGPYSAKGENSPQPAGPSISAPSRTVMPRNRVRIGIANARRPGSRSATRPSAAPPGRLAAPAGRPAGQAGRRSPDAPVTGAAGTWRSRGGASP